MEAVLEPGDVVGLEAARELFRDPIRLVDGYLAVPTGPGIGTEPDPDAIERYLVRA